MRQVLISGLQQNPQGPARVARDYAVGWIKNPDKGSEFEHKTRYVRWLPGWVLILLLLHKGYDGIIFLAEDNNEALGHVFFQRRESALHLFSIFVREDRRKTGISMLILAAFLRYAWEKEFRRVRMGAGRNAGMEKLNQALPHARYNLPFRLIPERDGWFALAS